MKTRFIILTALLFLSTPFISKYFHVSLADSVMAVAGLPLIFIMIYNIWRLADIVDRWSGE